MSDPVNHPPHYKGNGIETIDVIEGFDLGFRLGNAIKYILRAGKKGEALEDLKKARWYLDREIARLTNAPTSGRIVVLEAPPMGRVRTHRRWLEFWRW